MSPSNDPRSIRRIRTFANDVSLARNRADMQPQTEEQEMPMTTPEVKQPAPVESEEQIPLAQETADPVPEAEIEPPQTVEETIPAVPESVAEPMPQSTTPVAEEHRQKLRELGKQVNSYDQSYKKSILLEEEKQIDEETFGSGTIIRDTKRKRFRLIPAMISATLSWAFGVRDTIADARPKTHTVSKADTRTEVIQKAVEKGEQAPREDFKVVTQRLKEVERTPVSATLTFKAKEEVPPPQWSYVEDAEQKAKQPEVAAPTIEITPTPNEALSEVVPVQSEATKEPLTEEIQSEPIEPELVSSEIVAQQDTETYTRAQFQEQETAVMPEETTDIADAPAVATTKPSYVFSRPEPQQVAFPFSLLIGVIVVVSLLGAGVGYVFFAHQRTTSTPSTVAQQNTDQSVASLLQIQKKVPVPLSLDRVSTLSSIHSMIGQNQNIVQIYPTEPTKNGNGPAQVSDLLTNLGFLLPDSFARSIKEIDFGGVDGTDPYIVIRSNTFDTAFAGMLGWERYMSADLDPLFGPAVVETFDPTSQTKIGKQPAYFKDVIASNKNARLLLDGQGNDRIVYTFTDQNTILITTNRTTLDKLLQRVQ